MKHSKFTTSLIIDICLFVVIIFFVSAIYDSVSPIITNNMALGQMENSNDAYVMMSTYNYIEPLFIGLRAAIILWFGYTIVRDVYNYFTNIDI